jgi:archaellum component FlaG (FlaF/FlaG flagellin family)
MALEQKRVIYGFEGASLNDVDDPFFDAVWTYTAVGPVWADVTAAAASPTTADIPFIGVFAAIGDILYMGKSNIFYNFEVVMSSASAGSTKVLEYWNGASWVTIPAYSILSGSLALNTATADSNSVNFQPPDDWAMTTVNGVGPYYWIRLRVTVAATTAGTASTIWCDAYSATKIGLPFVSRGWGYVNIGAVYTDITSGLANITANPSLTGAANDALYLGLDKLFDCMRIRSATANSATRTWEYWNGAWTAIPDITAFAGSLNLSGANTDNDIKFTCPEDWVTTAVNGVTLYWIRARVTGAGTSGTLDYMFNGPVISMSKVVTVSETTSRTFLSVFASVFQSLSRAVSMINFRIAIKIGATARSYVVDDIVTLTNSGEILNRLALADFTSYFSSNFGAGTTATVTIFVSCVGTALNAKYRSTNAVLEINYEHDESDTTKTKTVMFALPYWRSNSGYLTTRAWTELQRSAIPQLTGGGEIVENTPTITNIFFEFKQESACQDVGMTSHWLEFKIDSGTVLRTFSMHNYDASGELERIIFDQNSLATGSQHSLFLRLFEQISNNHYYPGISCIMYVTYTYNHAASTSILNCVELSLDVDQARAIGGTDRNADEFLLKSFVIPETNPVLKYSSIMLTFNANSIITLGQLVNNALGFFDYIYLYDDSGVSFSANQAATVQNLISGAISTTGYRDRYDILYIGKSDVFRNINAYLSVASGGAREWSYSDGAGGWTSFHRSFGAVYTWDDSAGTFTDDTAAAASMDTNSDVTWTARLKDNNDAAYIGDTNQFSWISIMYSTNRNATASVMEYWNGSGWVSLNDYLAPAVGAINMGNNTAIHQIALVPPPDWATATVNGYTGYFIRLRNTGTVTTGGVANFINTFIDSFYSLDGNVQMSSVGGVSIRLSSPPSWGQNTVNGQAAYWVRARVVGANMTADQNITTLTMFKTHNFTNSGRMSQQFLNHRVDQGGTNPLVSGVNTFKFNLFRKASTGIDGFQGFVKFFLCYASDKHASGDGRHNRTLSTIFSQEVVASGRVNLSSKAFIAVGTTWFIQDMNYLYTVMASTSPGYNWIFVLPTAGEKSASGFVYDEVMSALSYDTVATELRPSIGSFVITACDAFMQHPNCPCMLNPFTARSLSYISANVSRAGVSGLMTLHKIPRTFGGNIYGPSGSGVGLTVEVIKRNAKKHEHVATVLSTAGPLFSLPWNNASDTLTAICREDAAHVGRSDDGVPT